MGVYTPHFNLYKPAINEVGWGEKVNQNFDIIDEKLFLAGFEKIAEIELTGDVDYVPFENLDGNNAWFYMLYFTIKNPTTSNVKYYLFVNNDTNTANYYSQGILASAGNVTASREEEPIIAHATPEEATFCQISITKDPFGYFRAFSFANFDAANIIKLEIISVCYSLTIDNITSLRIQSSVANAIGANSKFILFRIRRA